jgi:site-specific recombinase XerD
MAMTEKKRKTDYAWQKKNYKRVGTKLYRGDAEAFEEWCREHNTSVNAALKEYVSQCLGRPLEKRSENKETKDNEE